MTNKVTYSTSPESKDPDIPYMSTSKITMQEDSYDFGAVLDRPYLSAKDLRKGREGFLYLVPDRHEMSVPPILPQSSFTTR